VKDRGGKEGKLEGERTLGCYYATVTLPQCVCLLLQDLVQSCLRGGGGGIWEDMCYERRRAEACVD
jgi:hypothetical protein